MLPNYYQFWSRQLLSRNHVPPRKRRLLDRIVHAASRDQEQHEKIVSVVNSLRERGHDEVRIFGVISACLQEKERREYQEEFKAITKPRRAFNSIINRLIGATYMHELTRRRVVEDIKRDPHYKHLARVAWARQQYLPILQNALRRTVDRLRLEQKMVPAKGATYPRSWMTLVFRECHDDPPGWARLISVVLPSLDTYTTRDFGFTGKEAEQRIREAKRRFPQPPQEK